MASTGSSVAGPVTVTINSDANPSWYKQQDMGSDTQSLLPDSSLTQGIDVSGPAPDTTGSFSVQNSSVRIVPPQGQSLRVGRYSDLNSQYEYPWTVWGLTVSYTESMISQDGDVDILDLAADARGKLTRFDIVFRTTSQNAGDWAFGEISMGEPTNAVHLSTHNIYWPTIRPHSTITAIEEVHNTGGTAQKIGAARISGVAAPDYSLRNDTCSGRRLAPGATCTTSVAFTPTRGGARPASFSIPTGSSTQTVALDGSALLGTASMTTSGADGIDAGQTGVVTTHSSTALTAATQLTLPAGGRYDFTTADETAVIASGSTSPLTVGTHHVQFSPTSGYLMEVWGWQRACTDQQGTLNVHSFTLDGDGQPASANLTFTLICASDPTHPMTGTILWQSRSDTTAPKPPTNAAATRSGTARSVHWTASTSADTAFTMARLVEGDGTNATASSGTPLTGRTATSVALPALHSGVRYTVLIYAVNATGNASAPAKVAITG